MGTDYLHGTEPLEQERLARLNHWVNRRCLAALALGPKDRVIDFGSGLGNLTQQMAEAVGPEGCVVGIEQSDQQIAVARRRALASNVPGLEYRDGSVEQPPLAADEWGQFDVAHARFVLEHVQRPRLVVEYMVRSVRPGGRVVLADDDHPLLRVWPECSGLDAVWAAYQRAFERNGNDAQVGRRLVQLLHLAGAKPIRNDWIFFGSCSGSPEWDGAAQNLIGVLRSAKDRMVEWELIGEDAFEAACASIESWQRQPDAAIWYAIAWAEGVRAGCRH